MANARVTVPSGHLVFPQPSEHHWPAVLTREGIVLLPTFYGLLFAVGACREHARRQENATPTDKTFSIGTFSSLLRTQRLEQIGSHFPNEHLRRCCQVHSAVEGAKQWADR
jgi:hypothetical protein